MRRPFEQLHDRLQREPGRPLRQVGRRCPELGAGLFGQGRFEPGDEMGAHRRVGGGDLDFEQLGQARDAVMQQAAGLGDQHHGIAAGEEPWIAEPVMTDADALAVDVREPGNRRVGHQQVGALDEDEEVFGQETIAAEDSARAEAHLAQEFEGQRRVVDGASQGVVVGLEDQIEVAGGFALGQHALDGQGVAVAAAAPSQPGIADLFGVGLVVEPDGPFQLVGDDDQAGKIPLGRETGNERHIGVWTVGGPAEQIVDVAGENDRPGLPGIEDAPGLPQEVMRGGVHASGWGSGSV